MDRGDVTHSKSDQIMGSLNLKHFTDEAQSHSHAYLACFQAIILWQRAHGTSVADLERRWGKSVQGLDEFEEKWRDDRLFLISAMLNLWDVKVFYFHLKNECDANEERIKCIKRRLQKLRAYAYQTMDLVGWCSPLGPYLHVCVQPWDVLEKQTLPKVQCDNWKKKGCKH